MPGRRDLHLLTAAAFLSAAGDFVAAVTLALVVHETTGSGLAVSALFVAMMLPVVLTAPLAGALADRVESVRLIVMTSLACAVLAGLLAFAGSLPTLLILTAGLAALAAVGQPAEFALVPVVAGDDLTRANGFVESARYAGFAVGPPLAAAFMALGGSQLALLVNAASFLALAVAAGALTARRPPAALRSQERRAFLRGLETIRGDRTLALVLGASTLALVFISASITLEVFYVQDVLGAGQTGYALITGVWMAAMVIGAALLAPRLTRRSLPALVLGALLLQGLGVGGQTIVASIAVTVLGYSIGGLAHGVKNTLTRTLIQRRVPAAVHGRAFAAWNAARNGAEVLALAGGGVAVSVLGPRAGLAVAGGTAALVALVGLAALVLGPVRGRSEPLPLTENREIHVGRA